MAKDISKAVREVCLWFPETQEVLSHGSPDFRVRGKTFATYVINHHGDGRIALWINAPAGAQELYAKAEPKHFFVPPYVGPRGWLGINLDKGISWKRVAKLVREAYEKVAPPALSGKLGKTIEIEPPTATVAATTFDPMQSKRAQAVLKVVRAIGAQLPEVSETKMFGFPVWQAGKKTFVAFERVKGRASIAFRLEPDHVERLLQRKQFFATPYGRGQWASVWADGSVDWDVVQDLVSRSYRVVALKRMLNALEAKYPVLRGTIRDHTTKVRRPFVRFYACKEDLSHESPDTPLPEAVASGTEPFLIIGAMAGG